MRVLLVEPDSVVAQSIELMLKSESFSVDTTGEGTEGEDLGKNYDYDVIVISDTYDVSNCFIVRSLRRAKVKSSIIVLSVRADTRAVVEALGHGADDYLTKPFHRDELVARILAVVRRRKGHADSEIEIGNLCVNIDKRSVSVGGQYVHLTVKEYGIIEFLALRKNHVVGRDSIMNVLYGGRDEPDLKIIDVFICKLRKKMRAAGFDSIENVWGRGYRLRDPLVKAQAA
jgi:two-component system cell cycle response regulator CtrA